MFDSPICIKNVKNNRDKLKSRTLYIKKLQKIYNNILNDKPICKSPKKIDKIDKKSRKLTAYNIFVRKESSNPEYTGLSNTERMIAISKKWNKSK